MTDKTQRGLVVAQDTDRSLVTINGEVVGQKWLEPYGTRKALHSLGYDESDEEFPECTCADPDGSDEDGVHELGCPVDMLLNGGDFIEEYE